MGKLSSAEVPLNSGGSYTRPVYSNRRNSGLEGPYRALRLCTLAIILPAMIISMLIYIK